MIGITFCGKTGDGAPIGGSTLMAVTCKICQNAEPDPRRFRGANIPITINNTKTIHAGVLHHKRDMESHLQDLKRDAIGFIFDGPALKTILRLIDIERTRIEEEGV